MLCCAGVICSSFKCSDGTQHLAALLRGRVVFIQDRDTEAHCDLEHGDMERCNVQQSQYLQYLHNIYTVSTQYLHTHLHSAPQVLVSTGSMDSISSTVT